MCSNNYHLTDPEGFRTCRICKVLKPLFEMVAHKQASQGRDTKCKACQKVYLAAYIRSHRKEINKSESERKAKDPAYRLITAVRTDIWRSVWRYETNRVATIFGCTKIQLKLWLESHFERDMSWDSRPRWTIDHYIPLSFFDLTDPLEFKVANHWRNLRPVWPTHNRLKHGLIPYDHEAVLSAIWRDLAIDARN